MKLWLRSFKQLSDNANVFGDMDSNILPCFDLRVGMVKDAIEKNRIIRFEAVGFALYIQIDTARSGHSKIH